MLRLFCGMHNRLQPSFFSTYWFEKLHITCSCFVDVVLKKESSCLLQMNFTASHEIIIIIIGVRVMKVVLFHYYYYLLCAVLTTLTHLFGKYTRTMMRFAFPI